MSYTCFSGPCWVADVVADNAEEAIEKAKQIDPQVDTAEPKLK
jgi:hypothetical protein